MRSGRALVALAAGVCALALALGAAASSTSVTITTPTAGQKVSLKRTPYLAIAGAASFASASATATKYYLRRDDCGGNDNPRMSVTSGTDGGDGCGLIVNAVVGLGGDADQAAFVDCPAADGLPLALDSSRAINGVIDLAGLGLGAATVDVSMEALVNGEGVPIGADTETAILDPTASDNPVPFTIQPNVALGGADLQGVDLRVHIHGPQIYSGFIGLSGKSWVDVPSYAASVNRSVRVSIDDASLAKAVPARLDSAARNWSIAVATPAIGKHTIYVQSTQGFDSSPVASRSFTVTR
jgi:hypothetical protein